ncbi:rod shape-determining protein MreC [Sinomicrobium soli]|uniref:rod shape-determining protein MreC n=1 Tax=Sinomicrobium sp. N-1-3-6 TaxID=2219864 RepID=UPI000DCC5CC6|nr:rod shape-determining protein MreC [Sinomicrobium sp. N-1-3-6]RAV29759.1 rod shape-determining protein MreC [Sinomicrobium sp. N-1-3-6]
MQNIVNFFLKNRFFFLFLVLLSLSFFLTVQSHNYHSSKFINSANWVTGGIYKASSGISDYFGLRTHNVQLVEENKRLRTLLFNNRLPYPDSIPPDSLLLRGNQGYIVRNASVIKNSYNTPKNYVTIDRGENDGIAQDMGVITSRGIVGIIDNTSGNYATVQSVLNTLTRINAQLKNTNHFGSLQWDGRSERTVQLVDISRIAPLKEGDTVITGGMSTIFPKGIPIGTIENYHLDISENYYIINVALFNDMTNLGHVYIIENTNKEEIMELEHSVNE